MYVSAVDDITYHWFISFKKKKSASLWIYPCPNYMLYKIKQKEINATLGEGIYRYNTRTQGIKFGHNSFVGLEHDVLFLVFFKNQL